MILGPSLALMSAVSFSLANIFISRTTVSRGDKGVLFSVVVTLLGALVLWLVWGGLQEGVQLSRQDMLHGILWFSAAGVSVMVFGRNLLFISVRQLGVSRAAAVKRLNPFFSVILAVLVLGETLFMRDYLGITLIGVAFALLIAESFGRGDDQADVPPLRSYLFGVLAALAYACAYVLRKLGLIELPDAAFGTFVSAGAGLGALCSIAIFSHSYREKLLLMFSYLDRWVVLSAVCVSAGQILLFAALAYEKVSTVVMIASLEIFLSFFFSLVIFRTESRLSRPVLVSAVLALAGVLLVAAD
jgi:uncharacterized membrane protein